VLSSHHDPGNEETVHAVINRLFQRGANVIYHPLAPVHVSGHASQEEQKTLMTIVRPKFFVPIHGELRHLKHHAMLAQQVGIPKENIAVVENGYVLRFSKDTMSIGERIPGGYIFVDGNLVGEAVGQSVIQERESLATGGICSIVFRYDQRRGRLVGEPEVTSRGFANLEVLTEIAEGARKLVRQTLNVTSPTRPLILLSMRWKKRFLTFSFSRPAVAYPACHGCPTRLACCMARILIVYKQFPAPAVGHAGGQSVYHLLEHLHRVDIVLTLVARIQDEEKDYLEALYPLCDAVFTAPHHCSFPAHACGLSCKAIWRCGMLPFVL
jgi:hypothetical protein